MCLKQPISEKCHYREHVTANIWSTLRGFVVLKPILRDMVIRGMQTTRGYIELKIFRVARLEIFLTMSPHWLACLNHRPSRWRANYVFFLALGMGHDQLDKIFIVVLFLHIALYRKQHASTSLVRRHHEYGVASLMSRAYMHTLRFSDFGHQPSVTTPMRFPKQYFPVDVSVSSLLCLASLQLKAGFRCC
eukprot:2419574-Amphidinium_carterae.1